MTFTYTNAYTRAEAVQDQIRILFREAGISEAETSKICVGVQNQWLVAVGLYLLQDGRRVYEVEAAIDWGLHSSMPTVNFSAELPGWEGKGSPEALILGRRFSSIAAREGLSARHWGRFSSDIRADPDRHRSLCPLVGLDYGSRVADWKSTPRSTALGMQDLSEMGATERTTL